MSKRSRAKHARPQFEPAEVATTTDDEDETVCTCCWMFPKEEGSDICDGCASMKAEQ